MSGMSPIAMPLLPAIGGGVVRFPASHSAIGERSTRLIEARRTYNADAPAGKREDDGGATVNAT